MTRNQAIAQLRHLYQQLWDGSIPGSTLGQRSVAIGLLGPVIVSLETEKETASGQVEVMMVDTSTPNVPLSVGVSTADFEIK